jgi:hypothetical protein
VPFEVIRATPRTRKNANDLLESIGSGIVTFDYTDGNCPAFSPWEQRQNIALYSIDFANAYWTKNAILTSNTDVAPDGTTTASTFNDNTNNFMDLRRGSFTITANVDYTLSVFIKKTAGALTHYPGLGVSLGGGFATAYAILNSTTGDVNLADVVGGTFSGKSTDWGDYWRLELTMNSIYTSALLLIYPALSSNGTTLNSNAQGTNVFWQVQFELGSEASPPIYTTASAVTRNAEIIRNTSATAYIGATQGAIAGRFIAGMNAGHIVDISTGSTSNSIQIDYGNAGAGILRATVFTAGVPHTIISTTALSAGSHGFCFTYESGNFALYVDGALIGTNTAAFLPAGLDEIYIGSNIGASSWFNGSIPYLWFFNTIPDNPANESTK